MKRALEYLKKFGTAAKELTAILILGSLVASGFAGVFYFFAPASAVERAFAEIAQNSAEDKEFRVRYEISQLRREMRDLVDRTGTDDPLGMLEDARRFFRSLSDDLEYYEGIMKSILLDKRPKGEVEE